MLDLAARHSATALLHLRDYIQAAKDVDQYSLAASQIYEMARLVPQSEFIGAAADALDSLDFSSWAGEVREWVSSNGSPDAITDGDDLAQACLQAAIKSNEGGARSKAGDKAEGEDASDEDEKEEKEEEVADQDADEVADQEADNDASGNEPPNRKYRWD